MTANEPAAQDQVGLQFSVYPLRQAHLHAAIEAAVQAAAAAGVDVTVGRLSTFAPGDEESVFAAVRAAFAAAKSFGPAVMVVTCRAAYRAKGLSPRSRAPSTPERPPGTSLQDTDGTQKDRACSSFSGSADV